MRTLLNLIFKLAAVAIAPLGKEIVPASDPRAQAGAIVF